MVELITTEREKLYNRLVDSLKTINNLNRKAASFQANKEEPVYRWFKYKEGFSSTLVKYFQTEYANRPGKLLDPFAGVGTTLFTGQKFGWQPYGIELLPVGSFVMQMREEISDIDVSKLRVTVENLWNELDRIKDFKTHIHHIPITKGAFPDKTEILLNKYLTHCSKISDKKIQNILQFAAFSILEEISFTRKDGQYLRWDGRSKRKLSGKLFHKGRIFPFKEALGHRLNQIITDLSTGQTGSLFEQSIDNRNESIRHPIKIVEGSCLEELPKFEDSFFDSVITSPPYCNRYDYTRTYALELVFLGQSSEQVRQLRQKMLSCTVENREKIDYLNQFYSSIGKTKTFDEVLRVYKKSAAMTEINTILEKLNELGKLNNNNIPRMVKNYFLELCFVICEIARVLKSNKYCVMVNDNVRYGGEEVPVDLILSEFAENFGFNISKIFVLPKGKGNSSQQMGTYGRIEVRKSVYLWQKR